MRASRKPATLGRVSQRDPDTHPGIAIDGAHERLEAGTRYADIGCGAGHALIKLAQTYPRSSFVGYDAFQGAIEQAQLAAEHARVGPFGTLLYGISVLYCMTTSLAHAGAGLGTCGCPPEKVRQPCAVAGFCRVRQLQLENPFDILYEVAP